MDNTPQKRALRSYRARLEQKGLARFEVLGRSGDRELVRSVAKLLSGEGPDTARVRAEVAKLVTTAPPARGGILKALLRSPLVGDDLSIEREQTKGRAAAL